MEGSELVPYFIQNAFTIQYVPLRLSPIQYVPLRLSPSDSPTRQTLWNWKTGKSPVPEYIEKILMDEQRARRSAS
jgi:hypothetical protein